MGGGVRAAGRTWCHNARRSCSTPRASTPARPGSPCRPAKSRPWSRPTAQGSTSSGRPVDHADSVGAANSSPRDDGGQTLMALGRRSAPRSELGSHEESLDTGRPVGITKSSPPASGPCFTCHLVAIVLAPVRSSRFSSLRRDFTWKTDRPRRRATSASQVVPKSASSAGCQGLRRTISVARSRTMPSPWRRGRTAIGVTSSRISIRAVGRSLSNLSLAGVQGCFLGFKLSSSSAIE